MICINTAKHYFIILYNKSKKKMTRLKKLLEQVKDQIKLRHYSRRTEDSYIQLFSRNSLRV